MDNMSCRVVVFGGLLTIDIGNWLKFTRGTLIISLKTITQKPRICLTQPKIQISPSYRGSMLPI